MILSAGSYGCNLSCPFCQNYQISMAGFEEKETAHYVTDEAAAGVPDFREITPEELAELAEDLRGRGNIGVAFTYNEPLVGYEFVRDTARLVQERGMKNVLVTNGTAELPVLEEILPIYRRHEH